MSTQIVVRESNPETQGQSEMVDELNIGIIDISSYRRELARDWADEQLADETTRGGFRGFLTKVWKGNIAREYYREKYTLDALDTIQTEEDLFFYEGGRSSRSALSATVNRFTSEYEELIHRESGEKKSLLDGEESQPIVSGIKDLIKGYAEGRVNAESLEEEKNRLLVEAARQNPKLFGEGMMFADNLIDIAVNVRQAVEHGEALDEIMASIKITAGEAKLGVRTEAHLTKIDKLVEKVSGKHFKIASASTVALATAATLSTGKFLAQKSAAKALALTGAFGVGSAVIAGMREKLRIQQERAQHARDVAKGKEFSRNAKRRGEMEKHRYQTLGADESRKAIDELFKDESREELNIENADQYEEALRLVAELQTRIKLSDAKKIDLIHFSSIDTIEDERFQLDLALATAKVRLSKVHDQLGEEESGFDEQLSLVIAAVSGEIEAMIESKDESFVRHKRERIVKAALMGAAGGATVGFAVQEVFAHIPGVDDFVGMFEGEPKEGEYLETLGKGLLTGANGEVEITSVEVGDHLDMKLPEGYRLEGTGGARQFNLLNTKEEVITQIELDEQGEPTAETIAKLDEIGVLNKETIVNPENLGGETKTGYLSPDKLNSVILPSEYQLVEHGTGSWQLLDASGDALGVISLDEDGTISDSSVEILKNQGLNVQFDENEIRATRVEEGLSAKQLLDNQDTTRVHRTLWYDNNTPNIYDINELKLHAGGDNGTWFNSEGDAVIDISGMTPGGSFHGEQAAQFRELVNEGNLKLGVSISKDTSSEVALFDFKVDESGRVLAIIDKEHDYSQLFETTADGGREFHGAYLEVMEMEGVGTDGRQEVNMLSTFVGENDTSGLSTTIETTQTNSTLIIIPPSSVENYTVDLSGLTPESEVQPIVFPPVAARKGLEKAIYRRGRGERAGYGYLYGEDEAGYEELRAFEEEISPRLRRDSRAKLKPAEELKWYRKETKKINGEEYIESVDEAIIKTPELAVLDSETKAIVTIPVAALHESENIYRTLSLYGEQSAQNVTVMLYINYPDNAVDDPGNTPKIQSILDEIARARQDYPNLKVAEVIETWNHQIVEEKGAIIGHIGRRMYDIALMAVERAYDRDIIPKNRDVLLIRNDADSIGMSRNYLQRIIKASEDHPETDLFSGGLRWDTKLFRANKAFGVAATFYENLRVLSNRGDRVGNTAGGNSVIRSSILAAVGGLGPSDYLGAGSDDVEMGRRIFRARGVNHRGQIRTYGPLVQDRNIAARIKSRILRRKSNADSPQKVMRYVTGAQIDTNGDRMLGAFRAGKNIISTWSGFDRGGYSSRGAELKEHENKTDQKDEVDLIEKEIQELAMNWFTDNGLLETALTLTFGTKDKEGNRLWTYYGGNYFVFTPAGKIWLKNRLERDRKGRFAPYGNKTRRNLYGIGTGNGSSKRRKRFVGTGF